MSRVETSQFSQSASGKYWSGNGSEEDARAAKKQIVYIRTRGLGIRNLLPLIRTAWRMREKSTSKSNWASISTERNSARHQVRGEGKATVTGTTHEPG